MAFKAFKGFNKDMTCRGFQFKEGETYHEDEAKLCNSGFHACEDPLDCFGYYAPVNSIYREVEMDDVTDEHEEDTKRVGKTIKIGAEIGLPGIIKAHFEYVKSRCTNENNAEPGKPSTAGSYGAATAGDSGAATAGDRGAATSRGSSASGKNGLSVARGNSCKVKGGMGAVLVLVEENKDDYGINAWAATVVDGEKIKADTWYMLNDGKFVEVKDE